MTKPKYTYDLEVHRGGEWRSLVWSRGAARQYLEGYMECATYQLGPTLAYRLIRSDGKVMSERKAQTEANLGMRAACLPRPEEYEAAAQRALAHAAAIRARRRP